MAKVSDSTFEVRVEVRAFNKGIEAVVKKETYDNWTDADIAYEAYNTLTKLQGSGIISVELIEHRLEKKHKEARKLAEPVV